MIREIPTIKTYEKDKIDLLANCKDGKNKFKEVYIEYLQVKINKEKNKRKEEKLLKKLQEFEPKTIEYIHVERFIKKTNRLIQELQKNKKNIELQSLNDIQEKLTDKESINQINNSLKQNKISPTPGYLSTLIELKDYNLKKTQKNTNKNHKTIFDKLFGEINESIKDYVLAITLLFLVIIGVILMFKGLGII